MTILKLSKFHQQFFRFIWLIAIIAIIIIAVLAIREIHIMQTISNISDLDKQLIKIDDKVSLFNIISLVALTVTLIAGFFVFRYNTEGTQIRSQKIASLSKHLIEANQKIINLSINDSTQQSQLSDTQLKLKNAGQKLEDSRKANLDLAMNLEIEKQKTFQMQKDLAPRVLEQYNSVNVLKKFPKYNVIIKYVPDYETRRFVGMINFMVHEAGWRFYNYVTQPDDYIRDGVIFCIYGKRKELPPEFKKNLPKEFIDRAEIKQIYPFSKADSIITQYQLTEPEQIINISDELLKIFKTNNIDVRYSGTNDNPKENTIFIEVGLKPNKFNSGVETNPKRSFIGNIIY